MNVNSSSVASWLFRNLSSVFFVLLVASCTHIANDNKVYTKYIVIECRYSFSVSPLSEKFRMVSFVPE